MNKAVQQLNGETQLSRINWSVNTRHCAHCGIDLAEKKIVGSGSFSDGLFCSLDCYAKFYTKEIKERQS